jgi:regulator of extracellular matrix RemA (YlzA/DUF370 family)
MFLHIGYDNYVNTDKIIAIKTYGSAPSKRDVLAARDSGILIDCTEGRRTHSVIYTADRLIISSAIPETLIKRIEKRD